MASPTSSIDSLPRANSIGSFCEHADYLSLSPLADSPLTLSGSSPEERESEPLEIPCRNCGETSPDTKILNCLHSICPNCYEKSKYTCPHCQNETIEHILSTLSLYTDSTKEQTEKDNRTRCTGCKGKKQDAVAHCVDCPNYLCSNCVMAHQFMHVFENHRVINLNDMKDDIKSSVVSNNATANLLSSSNAVTSSSSLVSNITTNNSLNGSSSIMNMSNNFLTASLTNSMLNGEKNVLCPRHKSEYLKYYCRTCSVPICKECITLEHPTGLHEYEHINDAAPKQMEAIQHAVQEAKTKATDIRNVLKNVEHLTSRLQVQYHKAQNEINDTFQFYRSMLDERKSELLKELESMYNSKQLALGVATQKGQETVENIYKTCEFVEKVNKCASVIEMLMVRKLLDSKLQALLTYNVDQNVQSTCELEFVSNYQAIQVGVRNTFGYVRSNSEVPVGPSKQPPIARPTGGSSSSGSR